MICGGRLNGCSFYLFLDDLGEIADASMTFFGINTVHMRRDSKRSRHI